MKPLIYGYLRITDGLNDRYTRQMEHRLRRFAAAGDFCYATTFLEHQPGYQAAFPELLQELSRADAHDVLVLSLDHISRHPILRDHLVARLEFEAGARVWAVATIESAPPGAERQSMRHVPT